MKRILVLKLALLTLLAAGMTAVPNVAAAQTRGVGSKDRDQSRTLQGTVVDKAEDPLPGSVVYLKNTKTLAVKSFIADDAGAFRFPSLSPNVDYEVYAEFNGQRSATKTLSSFDSRTSVQMQLKIDVKK